MSSGKVHAMATSTTGLIALFYPLKTLEECILLSFGCFLGLFVYPDLDVNTGNYGMSLIRALFGDRVSKLWNFFWKPYSWIMPHRYWISHFPVVSTIVRLSYIGLPALGLMYLLGISWNGDIIYVGLGLITVDILHFTMDIVSTKIKRMF